MCYRPKHILFYDYYYIVFENEFGHRYGDKKAPVKVTDAQNAYRLNQTLHRG